MSSLNSQDHIVENTENVSSFLTDIQRKSLQANLQEDLSLICRQRIEIMLMADRGMSPPDIARELGCALVTAEYWTMVLRQGLVDRWQSKPVGRPRKLDDRYIERLKVLLSNEPRQYGYPFRRWTIDWLAKHLARELGVEISSRHLKRLLKEQGLSTCNQTSKDYQRPVRVSITDLPSPTLD